MPPLPDPHALAVLALTAVALVLFTRESIPLETSSLAVLVLLTLGIEIVPYEHDGRSLHAVDLFFGFAHEALIAVCALMVVGHGLVRTGALEPVGRALARLWAISPLLSLLITLVIAASFSAFLNNTPVVVLLLPILMSVSFRTNRSASGLLMPMGLATLVGGMATTIGTSTNLLVVSVAADLGVRRFEMFDFFLPAVFAGSLGILYLWLVAPRILPERRPLLGDTSPRMFDAHLSIVEGSYADGKTLVELLRRTDRKMRIKRISRDGSQLMPLPDVVMRAGDLLFVQDTPAKLKEFEQLIEGRLFSVDDEELDEDHPLQARDQQLAEIVVVPGSPLAGRTLSYLRFAERYQLVTLALHKAGTRRRELREELSDIRLEIGDILLVQGARDQLAELRAGGELLVLDATSDLPSTSRAPLALAIMGLVIVTAATGLLPIAISAVAGAFLMVVIGALGWRDVGNALSTQVILIVVVSLALGLALTRTGATEYLADLYLVLTKGASPRVVLSGLILSMAILTNIVSNNAAAVIGTPVAISIANSLGLPPEAFILAVLFGANMSYATPMAYKTNLLVMNAGNYTFGDFVRIGTPLTIIMWLALSWILPEMYGF